MGEQHFRLGRAGGEMKAERGRAEVDVAAGFVLRHEPGILGGEGRLQDEVECWVLLGSLGKALASLRVRVELLGDQAHLGARDLEALFCARSRRRLLEGDGEASLGRLVGQGHLQGMLQQRDPICRLAFEERHVRVEAVVERDQRAGEQRQDPDMGQNEAHMVRLPGVALHHHAEDVRAERHEDQPEPPGLVELALGRLGAVVHLVEGGDRRTSRLA